MNRFALCTLALLAGCASAPSHDPDPAERGPSLFAWSATPEPDSIERFLRRAKPLAGEPTLLAALARAEPDAAHGAWLHCEEQELRVALATALGAPAYAASEGRRGGAEHTLARRRLLAALDQQDSVPELARERAAEAAASFERLGDRVWQTEAQLCLATLTGSALPHAAAPAQEAPLAIAQLGADWQAAGTTRPQSFREIATLAERTGHWAALQRLESLRSLGVAGRLDPGFQLAWPRLLAQVALERERPLLAVRHALRALRAREALGGDPSADRVLLARAYAAAGRTDAALVEAQAAIDGAPTATARAAAHAALGEVLVARERNGAAAKAYASAEAEWAQAGDGTRAARAALNRGMALLRDGELEEASEILARPVPGLRGPQAAPLRARRRIGQALVGLLLGNLHPKDAAAQVEGALDAARAAGSLDVVSAYEGLVPRLRGLPAGG